jgi:SAM-dependent methyltransferase
VSFTGPRALSLARNALRAARRRGPRFVLGLGARWATLPLWRRRWEGRTFTFGGETYPYLLHNYNVTWSNERAVEVPIAWRRVERAGGGRVLEIGNVLSHYHPVAHEVVDKFERASGVRNEDVTAFDTDARYDLVVSISTLEHVGFDEEPRDPGKPLRAVANLRRLLAPGGELFVTMPLGYNPHVDRLLDEGAFGWTEQRQLVRVSDDNRWEEADWAAARGRPYDGRWLAASAVVFATLRA